MISESILDKCIERIANEQQDWLQEMADDQPVLAGYLTSEDLEAFTPEETQYLYYMAILIWMCFNETYTDIAEVNEDDLALKEDQNWNRIESLRPSSLKHLIDKWIVDYPEPEILFYLEDALVLDDEDPDHPVTKLGQIPLFVTLLSITDILHKASQVQE